MGSNLPTPNSHMEVLYRQTFNSIGGIIAVDLTQDNRVGDDQKKNNTRLTAATNKGILAGSVVAVAGDGLIGPAAGDSTTVFDKVVGVAVNDAVGNPYESSSAVASQKIVYAHGTGTVFNTDIYETLETDGSTAIGYTAGDLLYASSHGLLTNTQGFNSAHNVGSTYTVVGILLTAPSTSTNQYMTVQMKI